METLTFYSYKGGTGRSLLLANTARYLADLGKRVVALDFDLEAPGLHYKLRPKGARERTIDLLPERGLVDYLLAASADGSESVAIMDYVLRVPLPATTTGELHVFPAGAAPSGAYWRGLTTLTRGDFFTNPDGSGIAACLDLKARIEQEIGADFLLIDSRTGITEMAGLATTLLADTVVCLMIDNPESLAGTRAVLRSFGEAPRLPGLDPIRLLPVLSRTSRDDAEIRQRILEYLNEAGSGTEQKLALERIYILRTDPVLAEAERLLLTDVEVPSRSTLYQDYVSFLRVLVIADPALADAAERRRTTVARMKEFLTNQHHDRRYRAPGTFDIGQIEEGVEFGGNQKRYADLVVHDSKDYMRVLMAVEYVDNLAVSEAWRWWENSTDLQSVFLISQEEDNYLKMRLFTRNGRAAKFREHHGRFSWFIKWPVSFTALENPGDWSVKSMLKAVERGEDSFIGLLVAEWEQASFVTLRGGYSYRPNVARQIFDGLARITDPEIETRILWRTMPDPFERQYKSPMDDRVMDNLTISELHTPLWWRLSVQSRINFSVQSQSRHRLGSAWLDGEMDMLAHDIMGLTMNQDRDFRHDASRLVGAEGHGDDAEFSIYRLAGLFKEKALKFTISQAPPPELVRRAIIDYKKSKDDQRGDPWPHAESIARTALEDTTGLTSLVNGPGGQRPLGMMNFLCSYDPASAQVTVYPSIIAWAAARLGVEERALSNVAFLHATVYAVAHLGRDLDGRPWNDFGVPSARDIAYKPSLLLETLARYFSFRLLERLEDTAMTAAFERMDEQQPPEYQAWRRLRSHPLEAVRKILMRARAGLDGIIPFESA